MSDFGKAHMDVPLIGEMVGDEIALRLDWDNATLIDGAEARRRILDEVLNDPGLAAEIADFHRWTHE